MAAKIGPKIALNFDKRHYDFAEQALHYILRAIDPRKKIVFVQEGRCLETESLNQYSLELLFQDAPLSTSTACHLLAANITWREDQRFLTAILMIINSDPDMKKLFMEKSYFKFNPREHGLNYACYKLDEDKVTPSQRNIIKIIEQLFEKLDQTLPNLEDGQREEHFGNLARETANLIFENGSDYVFFARVWEAIAYMKIIQVLAKLGPDSDKSKELSLDVINRRYRGPDCEEKFFEEVSLNFRTRFQAQKVIILVEKILSAKNADSNTIFLVRDGFGHRKLLIPLLTQHFKKGEIKEIVLTMDDVLGMGEKIRKKFAAAPNLLPPTVGARSGTYCRAFVETNDLQRLPVFQFSE